MTSAVALTILLLSSCVSTPDPAPTTSPEPSATPSASTTPEPEPTPTPTSVAVAPTCENTSTAEFQAQIAEIGWVGWTIPRDGIGVVPFDVFPDGAPEGQISCRWGPGPGIGTDNFYELAWAPISSAEAGAAQEFLASQGFERSETPEGVHLTQRGDGMGDPEAYGRTYLFTDDDVRYAMFQSETDFVKAPDDPS